MMILALPASMALYSLLNMANWLNYELTGKQNIKLSFLLALTA